MKEMRAHRQKTAGLGKIQIHVLYCMLWSWLFLPILNNLKCLAPFSFTRRFCHLIPALCAHKRKGELSSQGWTLLSVRSIFVLILFYLMGFLKFVLWFVFSVICFSILVQSMNSSFSSFSVYDFQIDMCLLFICVFMYVHVVCISHFSHCMYM